MFDASPVVSFITTMPPNPIIDKCSPVLPSARRGIGFDDVFAAARNEGVEAAAAAAIAACFMNSRRLIGYLHTSSCLWCSFEPALRLTGGGYADILTRLRPCHAIHAASSRTYAANLVRK